MTIGEKRLTDQQSLHHLQRAYDAVWQERIAAGLQNSALQAENTRVALENQELKTLIRQQQVDLGNKIQQVGTLETEIGAGPLAKMLTAQKQWSEQTFGPGRRTRGVCNHIRKELEEIEAKPEDLKEWIDVLILGMDGFWRAGGEPGELYGMIEAKQRKNREREWPAPVSEDLPVEHIRNETPE